MGDRERRRHVRGVNRGEPDARAGRGRGEREQDSALRVADAVRDVADQIVSLRAIDRQDDPFESLMRRVPPRGVSAW